MTEVILDIKQWGNNLGVLLPAAVAREAHLHVDQRVGISVENNEVVIRPINEVPISLDLRKAKAHPLKSLSNNLFTQVCERLNQIIQIG